MLVNTSVRECRMLALGKPTSFGHIGCVSSSRAPAKRLRAAAEFNADPGLLSSGGLRPAAASPPSRPLPGSALTTQPPDYSQLDAQPLNKMVTALFRRKMVLAVGEDVDAQGCARVHGDAWECMGL